MLESEQSGSLELLRRGPVLWLASRNEFVAAIAVLSRWRILKSTGWTGHFYRPSIAELDHPSGRVGLGPAIEIIGANGEGRTPIPLREPDPKSGASANSATLAFGPPQPDYNIRSKSLTR